MKFNTSSFPFIIVFYVVFHCISFAQENNTDPFEIYTQDKNNKILIVPFESKMYASSIDKEIALANNIKYEKVKEALKKCFRTNITFFKSENTCSLFSSSSR